VVCSKTDGLHGSVLTPALAEELGPCRSNVDICALGPEPRHSKAGLASAGPAQPFCTTAAHSSAVSTKLHAARLCASPVLPPGRASFTQEGLYSRKRAKPNPARTVTHMVRDSQALALASLVLPVISHQMMTF